MKLPVKYDSLTQRERRAVREEYIRRQDGKCWFCWSDIYDKPHTDILEAKIDTALFPTGFFKHPIHLQHDHDTGWTEGAVHGLCNAYMWQYEGR